MNSLQTCILSLFLQECGLLMREKSTCLNNKVFICMGLNNWEHFALHALFETEFAFCHLEVLNLDMIFVVLESLVNRHCC